MKFVKKTVVGAFHYILTKNIKGKKIPRIFSYKISRSPITPQLASKFTKGSGMQNCAYAIFRSFYDQLKKNEKKFFECQNGKYKNK